MTKTYIISFDEKKKHYRLTPETGRVILVRADHKKFEWLKNQESGKVVKINESGRWTASKDYDGLYDTLNNSSKNKTVDNTSATKVKAVKPATDKKDRKNPMSQYDVSDQFKDKFEAHPELIELLDLLLIRFAIPYFDVFDFRFTDIPIPLAIKGSYKLQITDYEGFLKLNPLKNLVYEDFKTTIKKTVTKHIKAVIESFNNTYKDIPIFQIERKVVAINDEAQHTLKDLLAQEFGVNLRSLDISVFDFDSDCANYKEIKILAAAEEKSKNDAEAELDKELFERHPWAKKWLDIAEKPAEKAPSILGYHKLNFHRVSAEIHRYVEVDLTDKNIDQNIDPKSDKWPIIEKKPCSNCNESGKIVSVSTQRTGFLNLIKKQVRSEMVCSICDGAGYVEKRHYPYRFEEGKDKYYKIQCNMNLDLVVKEVLNKFISIGEFTKSDLLSCVESNLKDLLLWPNFKEKHLHKLWVLTHLSDEDKVDHERIDWSFIKDRRREMEYYASAYLHINTDEVEELLLPLLFKTQIINNGTKRRPKKEDSIYYKFTNKAKKLYKDL